MVFGWFSKDKGDRDTMTAELPELRDMLGSYELPTFPKAAMAVLRELRDPDTGFNAIAEHIALDPGLHLRVLRTTNAAAYGLSRKVDDLQHALTLLGRARLESLVVSVAVKKTLPQAPAAGFNSASFWRAAAQRASLARRACSMLAPKESAEALTAGLLQDLAVPILAQIHGDEYVQIYDLWRSEAEAELDELERTALGFDHAQMGALIAKEWDLSEHLAELILRHHHASGDSGLVRAVTLSSRVRDLAAEKDPALLVARTSEFLEISGERAEMVVKDAFEDARQFIQALH